MKNAITQLESYLPHASATEAQVIEFILRKPQEVLEMNLRELSKISYASMATLVRIFQKIGFSGFKEFKVALSAELGYSRKLVETFTKQPNAFVLSPEALSRQYLSAVELTFNQINPDVFDRVARMIVNCDTIHLYGAGLSYIVMEDFMLKLVLIKKPSVLFHDIHLQIVDSFNIQPGTLCMITSASGQTKETLQIAENIKRNHGILITLTQQTNNELAQYADYNLYIPRLKEVDRYGVGSGRICLLCVMDALYNRILDLAKVPDEFHSLVREDEVLAKKPYPEDFVQEPDLTNDLEETFFS